MFLAETLSCSAKPPRDLPHEAPAKWSPEVLAEKEGSLRGDITTANA